MEILPKVKSRSGIIKDLFSFLWKRKIWWLIPLIIILLLLIAVLSIGSSAGIAPFIYTFI